MVSGEDVAGRSVWRGGDARKARDLRVVMLMVAAISASMVAARLFTMGYIRPLYASTALFSLLIAALAGRVSARTLAIPALLGFGALVFIGLFDGYSCVYGSAFAFIPAFVAFCLLFGDPLWFYPAAIASLASIPVWFFLAPGRLVGVSESLSIFSYACLSVGLSWFVRQDLRFAALDVDRALAELQHRVRNNLQILLSLSAGRRAGSRGRPGLLRAQVLALRAVQDAVAASADYRTLPAGPLLRGIAAVLLPPDAEVGIEARGDLPVETAGPLALILAELVVGGRRPGWLSLSSEGGRGLVGAGLEGGAQALDPKGPAAMLLGQIGGAVMAGPGGWRAEFDATFPCSEGGISPGSRPGRRGRGSGWSPLLGKANRGRTPSELRRARSFADFCFFILCLFSLIELAAAVAGAPHRWIVVAAIPVGIVAVVLARAGRLRAAAFYLAALICAAYSLAVFAGPGAALGMQLFAAPSLFLFCLHFLGWGWGAAAAGWGAAIHLLWFFLMPGRALPAEYFFTLLVGFGFLVAAGLILVKEFGAGLAVKESLALSLERRLRDVLGTLADSLGEGEPAEAAKFERLIRDMERAHGLVSDFREPADVPMGPALEAMLAPARGTSRSLVPAVDASGALGAEKAMSLLLLAAELRELAAGALGAGGGTLSLRFSARGDRASLRAAAFDGRGAAAAFPAGGSSALRAMEERLGGKGSRGKRGDYSIGFPT